MLRPASPQILTPFPPSSPLPLPSPQFPHVLTFLDLCARTANEIPTSLIIALHLAVRWQDPSKCERCILGKQTRSSVPKVREGVWATKQLEHVYVNLCSPM